MARGSSHEANHCADRYGDVRDRGLYRHRIGDSQCGLTELISRGDVHRPTTTHSSVLRWHSAAARTAWLRAYPGAVRPKGCRRSFGGRCGEFTRPRSAPQCDQSGRLAAMGIPHSSPITCCAAESQTDRHRSIPAKPHHGGDTIRPTRPAIAYKP